MLPSSILSFLSVVAVSSASPLRRRCNDTVINPPKPPNTPSPPAGATPTLPVNGGEGELDGPGNTSLKHIVVGHGIQNYTCAAAGQSATATGALAVLWDIQPLYPGSGPSSISEADWTGLPPKVLRTTELPLNLLGSSGTEYAADPQAPFPPDADLELDGVEAKMKFLGHHYFDGVGTPTFDLRGDASRPVFRGKKDASVSAPATADGGLTGSGAVDWLRLTDKGTSAGVSVVYRVHTAGGKPAPCAEAGQAESVPYTAMYWFY
ncbi:hypothetical protein DL770_007874 [Monosporascus sp. CRB-9-2]|nr:hypothetical protein DL770_007874 [Monosporascus sp. CRB-9-2]